MIDYTKITNNLQIIKLLQQREEIEKQIKLLDDTVLIHYELLRLEQTEY